MNVWLHKQVLLKLAENGGEVPPELFELGSVCCRAGSLTRDAALTRLATEPFSRKRGTGEMGRFIPMEMRCSNSPQCFYRVGVLALLVCLWSCEWDPFGFDSKEIAHGYRLKRIGDPNQFALLAPYDTGGIIVDEIGWRKPFIIARAAGSEYWDRIDTDHAEHIRISDSERTSNPKYRTIPVENVDMAWNQLKPHKRMW